MPSLSAILANLAYAQALENDLNALNAIQNKLPGDLAAITDTQKRIAVAVTQVLADLKVTGTGVSGHDLPFEG